jgi:hypothetical protein
LIVPKQIEGGRRQERSTNRFIHLSDLSFKEICEEAL